MTTPKVFIALVLLVLAACSPQTQAPPAEEVRPQQMQMQQTQHLTLYAASTETRLFANSRGFELPDDVRLDRVFNRQRGTLLSSSEAASVARSVRVTPPPEAVDACAHTWRHVFVFYASNGTPLGALGYCQECGAVVVIGPEDPHVGYWQLGYNATALNNIIEAHGMNVAREYPE